MTVSFDPTYPLFPVLSFLGFIVCCIPLSWHIQAWNSGTCAYMIWTSMACLIEFVNCIVWTGNLNNPSPVWCDICWVLPLSHVHLLCLTFYRFRSFKISLGRQGRYTGIFIVYQSTPLLPYFMSISLNNAPRCTDILPVQFLPDLLSSSGRNVAWLLSTYVLQLVHQLLSWSFVCHFTTISPFNLFHYFVRLCCTRSSLWHPGRYRLLPRCIQYASCLLPLFHVAGGFRFYILCLLW